MINPIHMIKKLLFLFVFLRVTSYFLLCYPRPSFVNLGAIHKWNHQFFLTFWPFLPTYCHISINRRYQFFLHFWRFSDLLIQPVNTDDVVYECSLALASSSHPFLIWSDAPLWYLSVLATVSQGSSYFY